MLHWVTALLVLTAFAMIIGREFVEEKALRQTLLTVHRYAGITALLTALLRIPVRALTDKPDHGFDASARLVAAGGHGLLYLALFLTPALGYALMASRFGRVDYFGVNLPVLLARDRDLAETIESIHGYAGWIMLAVIGLHAAVALWHHHVLKDEVLTAMLPARSGDLPN